MPTQNLTMGPIRLLNVSLSWKDPIPHHLFKLHTYLRRRMMHIFPDNLAMSVILQWLRDSATQFGKHSFANLHILSTSTDGYQGLHQGIDFNMI